MGQAEPVALCKAARFLSGRGFLSRRRLRRYYSGRHWILRSPGAFILLPLHLLRLNARMQHLPHVLLRLLGFVLQLILPRLLKFDQLLGSRRVIWGLFHQIAVLPATPSTPQVLFLAFYYTGSESKSRDRAQALRARINL